MSVCLSISEFVFSCDWMCQYESPCMWVCPAVLVSLCRWKAGEAGEPSSISFPVVMGRKLYPHSPSNQKVTWGCCPPSPAFGHRASGAAEDWRNVTKRLEGAPLTLPPALCHRSADPCVWRVVSLVHLRSGNACSPGVGHHPSG